MNEGYSSNSYNLLLPNGQINQVLSVFTLPTKQDPPFETQPQEPVEVEAVDTAPVITPTQAGMAETQQVQIINATPVTPSTTPSPSSGAGGINLMLDKYTIFDNFDKLDLSPAATEIRRKLYLL